MHPSHTCARVERPSTPCLTSLPEGSVVNPWPSPPRPSAPQYRPRPAPHSRTRARAGRPFQLLQALRHGIYNCWGLQCFGCFRCSLGPQPRHGNPAPWQQCTPFFSSRGNFGADSNKFGPCPSHALRLSELQSIKDLLLLERRIGAPTAFIMRTNLHRFDRIPWRSTPLQKRLAALQLVVLLAPLRFLFSVA